MFLKLVFLFFIINGFVYSQKTNIILPKPYIQKENLENVSFQNGEQLKIIKQSDNNFNLQWERSFNIPAVLITLNYQYLYNYPAINDKRNICPVGYSVMSYSDFHLLKGSKTDNNLKNEFYFIRSEILNDSSSCSEGEFYNYKVETSTERFIGLKDDEKSKFNAVGYIQGVKDNLYYTKLKSNIGIPVRCIERVDYDSLLKNKSFSYEELLPQEFNNLKYKLLSQVSSYHTLKENEALKIISVLEFDENGKNISKVVFFNSNSVFKKKIERNFFKTIKELEIFPYYEDFKIKAKSEINVNLFRGYDSESNYIKLDDYEVLNNNYKLKNIGSYEMMKNLKVCSEKDFKFKYKTIRYTLTINDEKANNPTENYLSKVKATNGPIISLLSVIPGLGINYVKPKYGGIKMWHISVPVGAIAIASKIYSNFYYSRFLSDTDNANARMNYRNANISQKVFFTSFYGYCILGAIDFVFTFSIGCKNKALQTKVNRKLKDI
jgi:hypothetical protein